MHRPVFPARFSPENQPVFQAIRKDFRPRFAKTFVRLQTFPHQLQCLMGYDLATVNLGFVDHKHPNDVLNGTAGEQAGVLGPQELMDADNAIRRFKVESTEAVGRARMKV